MDFDLSTLCILGIVVVLAVMLLPRLLGGMGGNPYSRRGSITPTYDDPDIQSRGGFGGSPQRSASPSPTPSRQPSSGSRARTYDSPKIQSRGGFGGSKPK